MKKWKWIEPDDYYELHIVYPDEDDVIVLKFCQDSKDLTRWNYTSEALNIEVDSIWEDNLEEAKEEFERIVMDYYDEKISYYEELLSEFKVDEC